MFSAKELSRDVLTIFFGFARPVSCNSESEEIDVCLDFITRESSRNDLTNFLNSKYYLIYF